MMKKKDVYNKAKATWGIDAQVTKAVEELSELQKELCKFLLDDGSMEHIAEEMADVKIMVEQLELILECKDDVKEFKKAKIQRLSDRLDKEKPKYLTYSCEECKHNFDGDTCFTCLQYSNFEEVGKEKIVVKACTNCRKHIQLTCRRHSICPNYSEWESNAE